MVINGALPLPRSTVINPAFSRFTKPLDTVFRANSVRLKYCLDSFTGFFPLNTVLNRRALFHGLMDAQHRSPIDARQRANTPTATSLGFSIRLPLLILIAGLLAILYWILEGLMRHQYWYKYVIRYRVLRDTLNDGSNNFDALSVYDLTNHYGTPKPLNWEHLRASFLKLEPTVLYSLLGAGAVVLWWLVKTGMIVLAASGPQR